MMCNVCPCREECQKYSLETMCGLLRMARLGEDPVAYVGLGEEASDGNSF
jgi:hypothetical protein